MHIAEVLHALSVSVSLSSMLLLSLHIYDWYLCDSSTHTHTYPYTHNTHIYTQTCTLIAFPGILCLLYFPKMWLICYLLLYNKLSPNCAASKQKTFIMLTQVLKISILEELSWLVLTQDLCGGTSQAISRGQRHVRAWLGLEGLQPSWLTHMAVCRRPQFLILVWVSSQHDSWLPRSKWPHREQEGQQQAACLQLLYHTYLVFTWYHCLNLYHTYSPCPVH